MIATKGLLMEVALLPEVLVEFWVVWALVWPLGMVLAMCVGLRLFVQNAEALPPRDAEASQQGVQLTNTAGLPGTQPQGVIPATISKRLTAGSDWLLSKKTR
jgi:hypothetical protein